MGFLERIFIYFKTGSKMNLTIVSNESGDVILKHSILDKEGHWKSKEDISNDHYLRKAYNSAIKAKGNSNL